MILPSRAYPKDDGALVVEIDVELDVIVTLVFERKGGPLEYKRAICECSVGGKTSRLSYGRAIPPVALSVARERALDACSEYDRAPDTDRGT